MKGFGRPAKIPPMTQANPGQRQPLSRAVQCRRVVFPKPFVSGLESRRLGAVSDIVQALGGCWVCLLSMGEKRREAGGAAKSRKYLSLRQPR